jgi:hypothetical protein
MSYTTKPIEGELSLDKEYILVDFDGYVEMEFNNIDRVRGEKLNSPFKLDEVDEIGEGWLNDCNAISIDEIKFFREVIRQPKTNEFNTDSIAVTGQEEEAPQYVKLIKGGKWEFTGDKSLEDGNTVAVFNCKYSEKPLPSDFFDEPEEVNAMSEVEWRNGLPPVGCVVIGRFHNWNYTEEWEITYISEEVGCYKTKTSDGYKEFTFSLDSVDLMRRETPEQREERERLEAAIELHDIDNLSYYEGCLPFGCNWGDAGDKVKNMWLSIVDKTNYRK